MELFQTALLVHDDIMDRDLERRGGPSIHHQYEKHAEGAEFRDPVHYGCAMGMCAGDVAFFAAFEALSHLAADPRSVREVLRLFARELAAVGVAQAQDVHYGAAGAAAAVGAGDVERLYLYKTGRYTFSLPLCAGALLSGASQKVRSSLEHIGEGLGVVFQIKDDEIGLFGDPERTGKPAGSDVREGKKTIYYVELLSRVDPEQKPRVEAIYGAEEASAEDVAAIRDLTQKTGARDAVRRRMLAYAARARSEIEALHSDAPAVAPHLKRLLDYSLERTS
jgi:geranylgeranyl diphosphate synthase type I